MNRRSAPRAFSLVEVVIAVGVFGIAVGAILGLLPILSRQASDSAESLTAQGLPDSVRSELTRLSASGFDALASAIPIMDVPLDHGLAMVCARDGQNAQSLSYHAPAAPRPFAQQYFLVEVWRYRSPPLAFTGGSVLPLYVRISWPYRVPNSPGPTTVSERNELTFPVALTR